MSNAVCPNCGSTSFACDLKTVKNITVPVGMIYCTTCYAAIGTFDPSIHRKIEELKRIIKSGIINPDMQ